MHHLPVPKYLEHIFKRLRKEQAETNKTDKIEDDTESKAVDAAADDDNEFENEKEEEAPPTPVKDEKTGLLTNEEVDQLAKALGNKWEELAEELRHITQKDIKMFKEDAEDDELRARIALVAWQDKNGAEATKTTMIETLTAIGMEEMATSVFGSDKMEE